MIHGAATLEQWIHTFFSCRRQHVPAPMFALSILYVSARIKFLFIPGGGVKYLVVNEIPHKLWDDDHCYKAPEGLTCDSFS